MLTRPLLLALVPLLMPALAHAESVCIAHVDSGFAPKAPEAERPVSVGTLEKRRCYAVVERLPDRTRIWVNAPAGFQGEVEVKNDDLLQVLLDDVELRDEADGAVWGKVLSGTGVSVQGTAGGGMLRVKPVEGRIDVTFLVPSSDVYYGERWPEPDPSDSADPPWPEATLAVPPSGTELRSPDGRTTRATIGPAFFGVEDLLLDPARGELRFSREDHEFDATITIVAPTMWVRGTVSSLPWREDPPGGFDPDHGLEPLPAPATGPRQVGDHLAELRATPKSRGFGVLQEGARVTVLAQDKGWLQVTAPWDGGRVQGWLEKKRLFKEGKEQPYQAPVRPVAHLHVSGSEVRWADPQGHVPSEEAPDLEPHDPGLTVEPLRRAVLDRADTLRLRWADVLKTNPTASGEGALRVLVAPSGELLEVGMPTTTVPSEAINKLLLERAGQAVFEERAVPRKHRRSDPDLDWNVEVWLQLVFSGT